MFQGIYTALITPFSGGKVDEKAFQAFVEWQIAEGVHGLVPCGTTGESPTLSHEEHNRIVDLCIEVAKGRVKVMAGTRPQTPGGGRPPGQPSTTAGGAGGAPPSPPFF